MTPNKSFKCTPFFMVYGAEAFLPSDIEYDALRVHEYDEEAAYKSPKNDISGKEEEHLLAPDRTTIYQQMIC